MQGVILGLSVPDMSHPGVVTVRGTAGGKLQVRVQGIDAGTHLLESSIVIAPGTVRPLELACRHHVDADAELVRDIFPQARKFSDIDHALEQRVVVQGQRAGVLARGQVLGGNHGGLFAYRSVQLHGSEQGAVADVYRHVGLVRLFIAGYGAAINHVGTHAIGRDSAVHVQCGKVVRSPAIDVEFATPQPVLGSAARDHP